MKRFNNNQLSAETNVREITPRSGSQKKGKFQGNSKSGAKFLQLNGKK